MINKINEALQKVDVNDLSLSDLLIYTKILRELQYLDFSKTQHEFSLKCQKELLDKGFSFSKPSVEPISEEDYE